MTNKIQSKRGRPTRNGRKSLQFNIRMTPELRQELDHLAKLGGRPLSYQIEHMLTLAKMVINFCDGNDNLMFVENQLTKARVALEKAEK